MTLQEYQMMARETAVYPDKYQILYPAMGMCGEAGEAMEKIKKAVRKGGDQYRDHIDLDGLLKELGDVLWYVANIAADVGVSLNTVAELNIEKLKDRAERDVLKGEGDNR